MIALRGRHERLLTELIRAAEEAGDAEPSLDARLVSRFIHGAVIWPYRWFRPDRKIDATELVEACAEFVLCGVAGAGGRPAVGDPTSV